MFKERNIGDDEQYVMEIENGNVKSRIPDTSDNDRKQKDAPGPLADNALNCLGHERSTSHLSNLDFGRSCHSLKLLHAYLGRYTAPHSISLIGFKRGEPSFHCDRTPRDLGQKDHHH